MAAPAVGGVEERPFRDRLVGRLVVRLRGCVVVFGDGIHHAATLSPGPEWEAGR
jgi:hypothetical protein